MSPRRHRTLATLARDDGAVVDIDAGVEQGGDGGDRLLVVGVGVEMEVGVCVRVSQMAEQRVQEGVGAWRLDVL